MGLFNSIAKGLHSTTVLCDGTIFGSAQYFEMALSKNVANQDVRKALSRRVVDLYRRMCREADPVITMYSLEHTRSEVRHMVLLQFRKNASATDPRVIDMLLARGEMELQEARNQWKQRGHLMAILSPEIPPADPLADGEEFFRRFLDGTLDESALWCGHNRAAQRRVMASLKAGSAGPAGAEPWFARAVESSKLQ